MPETWLFLASPAGEPAWNMALDDALLQTAAQRSRPLLRVYSWTQPAVTFGYFQRYPAHLAAQYAVVRRPTGGGVVYHTADTTYTVVAPVGHALYEMTTAAAYCALHQAVAAAINTQAELHQAGVQSPSGQYECFQKPVHGDVVTDGKKIAGGAQRRTKFGMLHQGSIAASIPAAQLQRGFIWTREALFEDYQLPAEVQALAEKLCHDKYATAAWNRKLV